MQSMACVHTLHCAFDASKKQTSKAVLRGHA